MSIIPGVPAKGSAVFVLVTRVHLKGCGLVELWVNMEDCRKHIDQRMIEDTRNPERMFSGSEGKSGDFCLVRISGIWHRAWIVSVKSENYQVFLIDQGQSHVTTGRSLAWGRSDRFLLPPETESCVLANVLVAENESERAESVLESLPGRTLEALVQDLLMPARIIVLEVPAVAQVLCEAGLARKIPADHFGDLMQKCQESDPNGSLRRRNRGRYLYPALLPRSFERVTVTEVIDPHDLYCRLLIFSSALEMLSEEIQQHYEGSSDPAEAPAGAGGDPCAAKGSDGRWRRSALRGDAAAAAADGVVEVAHVDEGTTELVPAHRIKPLHEKFLRMPVVTYPCCLDGAEERQTWSKDQVDALRSLILHRDVVATFSRRVPSADTYRVVLYTNDAACVNSRFLEKASPAADPNASPRSVPPFFLHSDTGKRSPREEAAGSGGPVQKGSDSPPQLGPRSAVFPTEEAATGAGALAVGRSLGVKVTCVENPRKFWCQTAEKSDSLRRLMRNLQSRYADGRPESICAARSPDDGAWYRARILAGPGSPGVDVRFIDYGHVRKVPLRDVRPIDPAFLRLSAQAFQCCLPGGRGLGEPAALSLAEPAPAARRELDGPGSSPPAELRCVVKAVTVDEEGLPLNVLDIETPSGGAGIPGAPGCAKEEENAGRFAPGDGYSYPTLGMEVGGKEMVSVTSCRSVGHFFCVPEKNSHLLSKLNETLQRFVGRDGPRGGLFGPGSACLAKYPDERWYRGLVVERSGRIKVHFVDYGDTLVVESSDVCPFPPEAASAESVPPLAVLLGLSGVPEDAPEEANVWFADRAVGRTFAVSVVARGAKGKLIVELLDGSVNVNGAIREMVERTGRQARGGAGPSDGSGLPPEARNPGGRGARPDIPVMGAYGRPDVSPAQTREVFASCVVGPFYFWCQFGDAEQLNGIAALAQEVGRSQGERRSSLGLGPGGPCLALFSDDNRWYRAQVMHRREDQLRVVFVDYGNEAEVEAGSARPLPRALLQTPPRAFLCSLAGFEESSGSWDDGVYDDFYRLLVHGPLRVSVLRVEQRSETALPRHLVEIECEGGHVNEMMKRYWKPHSEENLPEERPENETLAQADPTGPGQTREEPNAVVYRQPAFSGDRKEKVYASCIVGPCFFWCQYANADDLARIAQLCQEAGQKPAGGPAEAAVPGAACLALFSADSRWYRAQVTDRRGGAVRVVFVDYGNEADVDAERVRPLPPALRAAAPQAFLCRLKGFDESADSWRDDVCEDFYGLLLDKPLRATVLGAEAHPEAGIPQYTVQVDVRDDTAAEWLDVGALMESRAEQRRGLAPGVQLSDEG